MSVVCVSVSVLWVYCGYTPIPNMGEILMKGKEDD